MNLKPFTIFSGGYQRNNTRNIPLIAYIDNKSVIEALFSTKLVDSKRLHVDIAAIREFWRDLMSVK